MFIKSLQLKNFRNYDAASVTFGQGINVLSGENASGKTNLLEAIYLLGLGKSPRTSREKELISFNAERAYIKAEIAKKYRTHVIEIVIENKGAKKIKIDNLPVKRLSELIGIVNVVYFSPDEMRFVKAGPDERRRFLDISLSQQSKTYFKSLAKYNKILQQRNTLLKNENRNENLKTLLSIWDEGMAEVGANLILARKNYVKKLSTLAKDSHFELSDGKETLSLQYECAIKGDTYDEIYNNLLSAFSTSVERDRALMYTSQGPHRDDIKIILNDVDARKFASQGQQRSVSLSVKIAELTLFKNETGEAPILLLDDVLSELDVARREKLIELANRTQTVITCTEFDVKPLNLSKLYVVKNGTVTETTKTADGTTGTVVTDKNGTITEVKSSVSSTAAKEAGKTGGAVTLPVEGPSAKTTGDAPAVEVTVPKSAGSVIVEIPVEQVTPGTVAVIVHADGTEEIVSTSIPTETGMVLTLDGSATVKIVDNAKVFEDIHSVNHWAEDAVDFVAARGMFAGTSETTFSPNSHMTRAMLMTVLARFDGEDTSGGSVWYEKGMEWAKANGVSDGSNPDAPITREQLAIMIWRYAGSPESSHSLDGYTDADEISGYALEAMRWANENGIINGYGNGLLGVKDNATRAQVAQMLMNFVKCLSQ